MRSLLVAAALIGLSGCGGEAEPHVYPDEARVAFHDQCPADDLVCTCTWDKITRALPYEDYEAAMSTFRERGTMDARVTRASTQCRERHAG